jgi:ribonuclease HIII
MSGTLVVMLEEATGERLYKELGRGTFQFKPMDHARWAASGEDVSVVWYRSGKLVVQGKGATAFAERHRAILGDAARVEPSGARRPPVNTSGKPTVGSDESGKGDYFGPLAVAAVLVTPDQQPMLDKLGVMDSKLVGDERIRRAEGLLLKDFVTSVRVLMPEAYNTAWEQDKNVNVLLGRMHAECINEVLAKAPHATPCRIVVDRFGEPEHVTARLSAAAREASFTMNPGGEAEPAVAAASWLARAAFLRGLARLQADAPVDLPLGASDPRIVPAARALVREGGMLWLAKFVKLHFRTTKSL